MNPDSDFFCFHSLSAFSLSSNLSLLLILRGREGGKEGGREGGKEGGREGKREGGRERGREGQEGGREGGRGEGWGGRERIYIQEHTSDLTH